MGEPLGRGSLHARVVEREPGLSQLRVLDQGVLESAERAASRDRALQQLARAAIAHSLGKVLKICVRLTGRERPDGTGPPVWWRISFRGLPPEIGLHILAS